MDLPGVMVIVVMVLLMLLMPVLPQVLLPPLLTLVLVLPVQYFSLPLLFIGGVRGGPSYCYR